MGNTWVPFKPGSYWVDVGFYGEIDQSTRSEVPSNLEARLLFEKDIGKFENIANFIFDRNYGIHANSQLGTGFEWITDYKFTEEFSAGVQYTTQVNSLTDTGNFNAQEHVLGPLIHGNIGEFQYTTGALFGLSEGAPAVTLRLDMQYGF